MNYHIIDKLKHIYILSKSIFNSSKRSKFSFIITLIKTLYYNSKGKNIVVHPKSTIYGINDFITKGPIRLGTDYVQFVSA